MLLIYPDIMCDIETTGLSPDNSAIIQIAAVRFNLDEQAIDPETFDRCLSIPTKRYWDESTREWWSRPKRSVLLDIYSRMEPPVGVVQGFSDWARAKQDNHSLRFWAKPISFDYAFISSYFREYDVYNPFDFREATDLRSYIKGLGRSSTYPEINVEFKGDAHNALMDSLNQINLLFEAQKHVNV
jgi:oligoribonuclease (3'-5' exoribonuclease)